jgi:mevalonate kinase
MADVCVIVPAKVMLSGEYAVLYGGIAALMPVARFLKISESPNADPARYTPIVRAAVDFPIEELKTFEAEHGDLSITVDDSEFFQEIDGKRRKLGLGLSAAEAVGTVAARFVRAGFTWEDKVDMIAAYAEHIHRHVQGGRGSGADVALCALRLPMLFTRDADSITVDILEASKIPLPLNLVWTGVESNTREKIDRFDEWLKSGGTDSQGKLGALIEAANDLSGKWKSDNHSDLLKAIDKFDYFITDCTLLAGIEYKLQIHKDMESWAKANGGRAKPTGAGGGDMILLVGDLPVEELDQLTIRL